MVDCGSEIKVQQTSLNAEVKLRSKHIRGKPCLKSHTIALDLNLT